MEKYVCIRFDDVNNDSSELIKSEIVFLNNYGIKKIYWFIENNKNNNENIFCIKIIPNFAYAVLLLNSDGNNMLELTNTINKNTYVDCIKL